jgi:hypothetical protein
MYLLEAIAASPQRGKTELHVPKHARHARLTLRCTSVQLKPSKNRPGGMPTVKMLAIQAIETDPPAGIKPIEWMLLCSVPTHNRRSTCVDPSRARTGVSDRVWLIRFCSICSSDMGSRREWAYIPFYFHRRDGFRNGFVRPVQSTPAGTVLPFVARRE